MLECSRIVPPIQYTRLMSSPWLRVVRSASEMRTRKRGAVRMISGLKVRQGVSTHNRELPAA